MKSSRAPSLLSPVSAQGQLTAIGLPPLNIAVASLDAVAQTMAQSAPSNAQRGGHLTHGGDATSRGAANRVGVPIVPQFLLHHRSDYRKPVTERVGKKPAQLMSGQDRLLPPHDSRLGPLEPQRA